MVRSVRYTKLGRLKSKEAIERILDTNGYISIHQAIRVAEKNGIVRKSTVGKIFYALKNVEYISIWNPGNIEYFNSIKLCPKYCNTVVAKKTKRKPPGDKQDVTFCTYDGTKDTDYYGMLDILRYKGFKRAVNFPPLLGQYKKIVDGDRRLLFWAEQKDLEDRDLPEHMPELLDDQE